MPFNSFNDIAMRIWGYHKVDGVLFVFVTCMYGEFKGQSFCIVRGPRGPGLDICHERI